MKKNSSLKFKSLILEKTKTSLIFLKKLGHSKIFLIISSLGLFLCVLTFVFMSIFGPYWQVWPKNIRFSLALNRLAVLIYEEPNCHLDCHLEREIYRKEISQNLNNPKSLQKISQIIFREEENLNWRLELLAIVLSDEKLSQRTLFSDLEEYLVKADGNLKIQNILANYFSSSSLRNSHLEKLKNIVRDSNSSLEEKLNALKMLKNVDKTLASFYLEIIEQANNAEFISELLRSLAVDEARFDIDRGKLALSLADVFSKFQSSLTLRRLSIFVLSDFLEEETSGAVFSLFDDLFFASSTSDFEKYFLASNILAKFPNNSELQKKYALREIKEDEWLWYGEQK